MSAEQIIAELPNLTADELRAVRRKLIEVAEENEEVALCDAAALEGVRMLDRLENENRGR
jgi:hypothetical protein